MSILIKGMEMPTSCYDCYFCRTYDEPNQGYFCIPLFADLHRTDFTKKRIDACPLIEVPEQKHGKWKKAYLDHEAFGIRPTVVYCSECNLVGYWEPKYCPNCGAEMESADDV